MRKKAPPPPPPPPRGFHMQRIVLRINATQGNIRNADSEFKYNHLH